MIDLDERMRWTELMTKHICDAWGWQYDEPEAAVLAANLVFNLEILVAGTRTSPQAMLEALLSNELAKQVQQRRTDYILKG